FSCYTSINRAWAPGLAPAHAPTESYSEAAFTAAQSPDATERSPPSHLVHAWSPGRERPMGPPPTSLHPPPAPAPARPHPRSFSSPIGVVTYRTQPLVTPRPDTGPGPGESEGTWVALLTTPQVYVKPLRESGRRARRRARRSA